MTNKITVTPDYTRYYSEKSKEWAISEKIVDSTDYSSKYYANESKKQADISTAKTTEVVESGNTAVSNIENARDNVIIDIINQENLSVENVNAASATQISNVNKAGAAQVANVNSAGTTQVNLAKEQVTLATNQANIAKNQATIATNKTTEVVASGNTALSNIDTAKSGALSDIADLKNTSITDITNLKNTSVSNITTAKNNAITSITTQETTSKNNVIKTGNEQVERVNLTGVDNRTPIFSKSEIGTNESVYQNVYDLKHSTFDLSKFEVVGSPTITDNGVASGFSGSNFVRVPIAMQNAWKIQMKSTFTNISDELSPLFVMSNFNRIILGKNGTITMFVSEDNATIKSGTFNNIILSINKDYLLTFEFDGVSIYTFTAKDLNTNTEYKQSFTLNSKFYSSASNWAIGSDTVRYVRGSIDLKQFSITVDGVEVFSGNKTGIDTIKPDNYTVVGSLVISDDGVASGFSNSNYITVDKSLFITANSWKIECPISHTITNEAGVFSIIGANCLQFTYNQSSKKFTFSLSSNGTSWDITNTIFYATAMDITKDCTFSMEFTGSQYIATVFQNGVIIDSYSLNSTSKLYANAGSLILGNNRSATSSINGSIDLNAFKIYVDGNLVYQACLKIPYTESKTGSKIVSAYARDRVIDLYEQEGQAGYYTIDEENENFTLPMGEIYRMIGQRSLISSTVTETNRVDIYSDKTCLICGNVATAGTINLPIELVNNNYFITLSTSEKTATSFTTTATGDYILIGKVI